MSSSNCCFLTCIQVFQEAGQVVWYSHLFQNIPQFIVIHTVKSFGIVNKAEIDVSLEVSCFCNDPADVGSLISGSSAFSKTSLNKLTHIYMEFRNMVMITLYARQQKRHRCIEQSFGLCGRGRGWDDLGECHWNMYIIICETNRQSRFDAWDRVLGAGALGWPRGMGWGGRREGGSGWGTHVHPRLIHVNV